MGPAAAWMIAASMLLGPDSSAGEAGGRPVDFNREVRPILSNRCFACHGPDAGKRKGAARPLRLDTEEGAFADLGGHAAVVRGDPEASELIRRIASDDPDEVMPPPGHAARLPAAEVERLSAWVQQGAPYARHWAYRKPARTEPPEVRNPGWSRNPVDRFLLSRIEKEGLAPSPEADRGALIRRLALDLTGLPPTPEEVDAFARDDRPDAYEDLVDRLLDRPTYGEHWARMWLDLARYADSAGYADDPPRVIWAYRDYVIRSFNANKPFDRMTIEQIAGDLLPGAGDEQLVATAFHRNTMTNSEGGTNDEEFRNAAVVDRVNTTMAVWMGTTIACCQCHDHKYDPLSQADYFRLFAFFNNTQDADRNDESPRLPIESDDQKRRRAGSLAEADRLEQALRNPPPGTADAQARWEKSLERDPDWEPARPTSAISREGARVAILDDRSILVGPKAKVDVTTLTLALDVPRLTAIRLEALPDDSLPGKGPGHDGGAFAVTGVRASIVPPGGSRPVGRYIRVELPGKEKIVSLAEVQVFRAGEDVAARGEASQSSTDFDGPARLAIDGNTDGDYTRAKSTTHTARSDDPWWEVDLKAAGPVDRIAIWSRTDGGLQARLDGARIVLLDEKRNSVWTREVAEAPKVSAEFTPSGERPIAFAAAFADEPGAADVIGDVKGKGWTVIGPPGRPHALTLVAAAPIAIEPGSSLSVSIEQRSKEPGRTLGRARLATSGDDRASAIARTPPAVLAALRVAPADRTEAQKSEVARHYLAEVAPELQPARDRLAALKAELAGMKPETSVPVLRELAAGARRKTQIQRRGNFMDLGDEVAEGVPEAIFPLPPDDPRDRLALARWLVSPDNPLTARVIANRSWETIFGAGLVPTGEEFGSQGEPPTHPELLDWLATELVGQGWDLKRFLRLLVTSAAYRQSSRVTPDGLRLDPANRWLARGPRFRLPAETVRDQALAVSGLLSPKMYGPPVRPPQPSTGLTAAFGGGIDWQTSTGDDKHRRALYTTWRRSNPYPSMATFDAPNREICTVRRIRTNTPLQALVTLNDPVYIEAAQGLARRIASGGPDPAGKIRAGFRLCLARDPTDRESDRIARLFGDARLRFGSDPEAARKLATDPIGPAPAGSDLADLAAWTVVANVLLNLDETLMRR